MPAARQLTDEDRERIRAFMEDECPLEEIVRTIGAPRALIIREFPGYRLSGDALGQIGVMKKQFRAIPNRLQRTPKPYGR